MEIIFYNKRLLEYAEYFEESITSDITQALEILEIFGNEIGLPHSKSLGRGLFELRCLGTGVRILYIFLNQKAVILHIIVKKQSKIAIKDLNLVRKRQKDVR